ncbi:MAG TPA: S8 family serine peptidase [Candidatus Thermoplasmatota archaeon]|nr:S8 family serine peptidase [Candidatus Thermoplasmatota archaeon]
MRLPGLPAALVLLGLLGVLVAAVPVSAAPTGEGIVVAVLDSGVDSTHPELQGRVERLSFQPVVPGLPLGPGMAVADPNGQGTAVASIIAGANLGLAPQARILDLQVSARYTGTTLDPLAEQAAIDAMDYLLANPGRAQVAILSFASRGVSATGAQTLAEQAQGLRDKGVLVIVPSGPTLSQLHGDGSVVTVAGTDCAPGAQQGSADRPRKPDLVAEHANVRAAQAASPTNPSGGGTGSFTGSAYAAAQVAGAAALMLDARDDLPVDAAAAILRGTAAEAGEPGVDECNGFGLLTPTAAWAAAEAWSDPLLEFPTKPTPAPAAWLTLAGLGLGVAVLRRRA